MKTTREALKTPIKVVLVTALVIVLLGLGAFSVSKVGALQGSNGDITLEKAIEIALKDAGFESSEATITKSKPDRDDGINKYDVEFLVDGIEYDYEIDATNGRIIKKELDREYGSKPSTTPSTPQADQAPSTSTEPSQQPATSTPVTPEVPSQQPAPKVSNTSTDTSYISVEDAKAKALADAGLTDATYIKAELDRDDGKTFYEIEFKSGGYEYDYEIDALTGAVLDKDIDRDDD